MEGQSKQVKYAIAFSRHAKTRLKQRGFYGPMVMEFVSHQKPSFDPIKVHIPGSSVTVVYRDKILPGRPVQRIIVSVMFL